MKKFHAYLYLGWHFLLHVLRKVTFTYRAGGIARVRENFEPEGITPLTEAERDLLHEWQRCIGCGFCEAVSPELSLIPENAHQAHLFGPQFMAESAMRDLSHAELALPSAETIARLNAPALEGICPVGIPLVELAEFLMRLDQTTHPARQRTHRLETTSAPESERTAVTHGS